MSRSAHYDTLTDLPNRSLPIDHLRQDMASLFSISIGIAIYPRHGPMKHSIRRFHRAKLANCASYATLSMLDGSQRLIQAGRPCKIDEDCSSMPV